VTFVFASITAVIHCLSR